jgi:hypothetical protein
MRERHLSFFYLNGNHVPEHREDVVRYLEEKEKDIVNIGFSQLWIDLHNSSSRENPRPTGHLYIQDIEDNEKKFEEVCKYVLSKDRKFIPVAVDCRFKEDYKMIESILKENYGEKGRLTNGLLWLGVFGPKNINGR